jgi:hypothetical protein
MPAVTVGVSISFGILDILNIAHPAFIILGSYIAYTVDARFGVDPIVASIVALPVFYGLGAAINQVYYLSFEKRGQDSLRGLALFFGMLFIRRWLAFVFGVDYRYVQAGYIEQSQVPLGVMRTFAALVCPAEQLHMHQPLHVSDHGDAGGKGLGHGHSLQAAFSCRVRFGGRRSAQRLHVDDDFEAEARDEA